MTQTSAPTQPLLTFVHISDTHLSRVPDYKEIAEGNSAVAGARALVRVVNALPFTPDFILHTGDVSDDLSAESYESARGILGELKAPVVYVAGNHDDPVTLQRVMLGRESALKPFDDEHEIDGVQIVTVDSNGPAQPPRGYLKDEQIERLRRIASDPGDTRPLVVAVHHNVLPTGTPWWDEYVRILNGEAMHEALLPARHRLCGVFHGHVHQGTTTVRDGIVYTSVVSSFYQLMVWPGMTKTEIDRDLQPGFNVVTVARGQTFIRRHHFSVAGA